MLEQIMRAPSLDHMERGLSAANLRHEVIANNLANVNTPSFKRSEVVFEELLAREIYGVSENTLPVVRTHDRHLPIAHIGRSQALIREDTSSAMRVDKNNVDVDHEMADLAKNQIYYNALANQIGAYISRLRSVISSSGE